MAIDVTVLRVFTDPDGNFGNPLGVVDASTVDARRPPADSHRIGLQRNDIHRPAGAGSEHGARAHLHACHRIAVRGASDGRRVLVAARRGTPIHTLQVPAGIVQVAYEDDLTAVSARSEWAPEFAIYDLESTDELFAADPDDYPDDIQNYLWTWTDKEQGVLRSRMFAANLGVPEDEATGAAAVRITDYLSRDLTIVQGKGSVIETQWSPEGWVRIAGRVVSDGTKQID